MKMKTSAEQVHHGQFNASPDKGKEIRLFIDLDVCASDKCGECVAKCSYFYHRQDPENNGVVSMLELATYALVCRRCEEPHCVNACPVEALEQLEDKEKMLVRHTARCVMCRSCSHACPYGTIYPELLPVLNHNCDFCLDRREDKGEPLCVKSCPHGALDIRRADEELGEDTFLVGDNIIVHSTHWQREKV